LFVQIGSLAGRALSERGVVLPVVAALIIQVARVVKAAVGLSSCGLVLHIGVNLVATLEAARMLVGWRRLEIRTHVVVSV